MSFMLVFREIAKVTDRELSELETMRCMDILNHKGFFCILSSEAMQYHYEYKNILEYCKKLRSQDGVEIFVAKSEHHDYRTDAAIYKYLYGYSNEFNDIYVDITERCGEVIKWYPESKNGEYSEKLCEWQIPNVAKNSRLFYMANN